MNEPSKHHFVPEVYLQRFAINKSGDLFKLSVKNKYLKNKTTLVNKSQVCYEFDMYRFENKEYVEANNLSDPNFIEKNVFVYEDSELTKLFDKAESKIRMVKSEYRRLLQIMINIKRRNPAFRNEYYKKERDEEFVESRLRQLKSDTNIMSYIDSENLERIKKETLEQMKDDKYRRDMYRNNLLMRIDELVENENNIIDELMDWQAQIYQTNFQTPFITSDNPGFTVKNENEVYNTNLKYVNKFVFPLSPRSLLILTRKKPLITELIFKDVEYLLANNEAVLFFNGGTYHNSTKCILGNLDYQLLVASGYN